MLTQPQIESIIDAGAREIGFVFQNKIVVDGTGGRCDDVCEMKGYQ